MPTNEVVRKTLEQVAQSCGRYPPEAFEFVRDGLSHTVECVHGPRVPARADAGRDPEEPDPSHHVTGQQLSMGLRDYAISRYGMMALAVLHHWHITRTIDFGRIVFAMVESRFLSKTPQDDIRDFENVFDFATAFAPPLRPACPAEVVFQL